MENNQWKWVYVSLSAAVFFILLIFAGGTMDGMSGGYAVMFIAFFLTICSFAVALLFFTRARTMDAILGGKTLLAHWVYPLEETQKSAEREFALYREINRSLFIVVSVFMVIAMVFAVLLGGEAGILTAGILLLVLVIIAVVAWAAPKLEFRRALHASREVYIAENGIIYEGSVYPFSSFMMRMDGVRFMKAAGDNPALMAFSFMQLVGLFILRPFEISLPVPAGEEQKAKEIVERLGGSPEEGEAVIGEPCHCPACGAVRSPGERFCESCGEKIPGTEPIKLRQSSHCPHCGGIVKPGAAFCGSCGKKVE